MLLIVFVPAQVIRHSLYRLGRLKRRENSVCKVTANILKPLGLKRLFLVNAAERSMF
jgi:purine nucleoside phosphorylase